MKQPSPHPLNITICFQPHLLYFIERNTVRIFESINFSITKVLNSELLKTPTRIWYHKALLVGTHTFQYRFRFRRGTGPMLLHQRHRIFFLLFLTQFFHPWFLKKWRTFRWEQWSTQTTMYKVLRTSRQRKFYMTSRDHFQNFFSSISFSMPWIS